MKTIEHISELDQNIEFKYQPELTLKLDSINCEFTQEIINEIVLWKVNRFAKLDSKTLNDLNKIQKSERKIDIELTREILFNLLKTKGIRLAMASTILRFRNPLIYQIIDQRVYRFIYALEMKYSENNIEEQINFYLDYLERLKKVCNENNIKFEESDRIFYILDKAHNTEFKIKY